MPRTRTLGRWKRASLGQTADNSGRDRIGTVGLAEKPDGKIQTPERSAGSATVRGEPRMQRGKASETRKDKRAHVFCRMCSKWKTRGTLGGSRFVATLPQVSCLVALPSKQRTRGSSLARVGRISGCAHGCARPLVKSVSGQVTRKVWRWKIPSTVRTEKPDISEKLHVGVMQCAVSCRQSGRETLKGETRAGQGCYRPLLPRAKARGFARDFTAWGCEVTSQPMKVKCAWTPVGKSPSGGRHESPEFRPACERKKNRPAAGCQVVLPPGVQSPEEYMAMIARVRRNRKEFRRTSLIAYRRSLREE